MAYSSHLMGISAHNFISQPIGSHNSTDQYKVKLAVNWEKKKKKIGVNVVGKLRFQVGEKPIVKKKKNKKFLKGYFLHHLTIKKWTIEKNVNKAEETFKRHPFKTTW